MTSSFNRTSLLLSGPACSGKSSKITAAITLALEAGLKLHCVSGCEIEYKVEPYNADIVIFNDARSIEELDRFVRDHSPYAKQFLISTCLEIKELKKLDSLRQFNIIYTPLISERSENKSLVKAISREWAEGHFLKSATTSSNTDTSSAE
jgi:hypothetical protein